MNGTKYEKLSENDYFNAHEAINELHEKSRDYKEFSQILNEIKKYDIFDFLARVASLNLIPENQNKSILLDTLIASILTLKRNQYSSSYKMSGSKFRKIIMHVNNLDMRVLVDPSENIFIENVMFYDNYKIFTGINYLPGYCIQMMIYTLFLRKNSFNTEFLRKASNLIQLVLEVSNIIANQLGYDLDNIIKSEEHDIIIPNSEKLTQMADLITVDNNYIENLIKDNSIIKELYSDFGQGDLETALCEEKQNFIFKPFIKRDNKKSLILNPSDLSSFIFHLVILLAGKYSYKDDFINAYNSVVWKDCCISLSVLGHKKIVEKNWGIDLVERDDYKERLLNVCNNQIMIITCFCDNGKKYSNNMVFEMLQSDELNTLLAERLDYIYDKLYKQNIKDEDIFHITIINTYGRGIMLGINKKYYYRPIAFNPFDLRCISINEKANSAFLPRYIRARSKLRGDIPHLFSELNSVETYVKSNYSFYIDDNFNPKNSMLYIAPGDSINYIHKAVNKEKRHLVESYIEGFSSEVVINDLARNIYTETKCDVPRASLLAKFRNVNIWIYSGEITDMDYYEIYFSTVDAISFWLEEYKNVIECYNFKFDLIKLQVRFSGEMQEYFYDVEEDSLNWKDVVSFELRENNIVLTVTPAAYRLLNCIDNRTERQMIESIIDELGKITKEGEINKEQLERTFEVPFKKKFVTLDYSRNPYLKPISNKEFRKIRSEDENELLDNIGCAVLASGNWSYGIVRDEERPNISNYVVEYLYKLLKEQVSVLQPNYFVELIINDLEKVMYNLMLTQKRYAYDVACYPEQKENIFNGFNELNKTSRALKYLAEYISACPPTGTQILGEWQYEKLLAICSLTIDWAYKNDLFHYKIFNTPVEILKSDRIGMKHDEFNALHMISTEAYEMRLNFNSTYDFREKLPRKEFPNIEEELNEAFFDEYKFSFDKFILCILQMISFGDAQDSEVKKADKGALISWIVENSENLNFDIVEKVIEHITLKKREDFLKPGKPYRTEDVYPWRFNRDLSFTKRPVILRDNLVIWGNRQLFHLIMFTIDLIYEGSLKTRGKKLSELIGKISNKRGADFNNQVYNRIKEFGDIIVDKNLKKVNHKKIADENGNTLGDIDILYIIPNKKIVVVAEVKDFKFSKSPYEMDCEYKKMFEDKDEKKCFYTKHKRRVSWVCEHLEDIKSQYGLSGDNWTVKDVFIVSEAIISNAFYKAGATIITYNEIKKERLLRI